MDFIKKGPVISFNEEDSDINSAANALFILCQHLHGKSEEIPNIKLGDTSLVLDGLTDAQCRRYNIERIACLNGEKIASLEGKGGFKKVFGLDGRAICIPNLDVLSFKTAKEATGFAKTWCRQYEKKRQLQIGL